MADFDLSARITADASSLVSEGQKGASAIESVGKASRSASEGAKALETATTASGKATATAGKQAAATTGSIIELAREQREAGRAATEAGLATAAAWVRGSTAVVGAQTKIASSFVQAERAQARSTAAHNDNAAAANRAAFGARNLGQQVGDFATQVSLGGGVVRAFSSQIGQAGFAMSEMGGKIGAVGKFLVGPWGIALNVAALVLAPFVAKLVEGGEAAEDQADSLAKAAAAADSYGNAQSLLGKVIELTTGKLKTQNAVLVQTIRLQAQANILKAQADQKAATGALQGVGDVTVGETFTDFAKVGAAQDKLVTFIDVAIRRGQQLGPLKKTIEDYVQLTQTPGASQSALDRGLAATTRQIDAMARSGRLAGRDLITTKQAVLSLATTINDQKANQLVVDAIDGKGVDPRLVPFQATKKPPKPKKPAKAKVDTTTPGEAEAIQRINEEFDRSPTLIDKAAQATRKLDAIIADLSKRKPPGFEKLIADANAAKQTIQSGLQRPYDDFIKSQQDALAVQELLTAGRIDEANALRTVQSLQATMGPLTDDQKKAILATNQALRAEQRELDVIREKNAKYVEALSSIKGIVQDATQAFVRGDLGQLIKSPSKLLDAFQTLQGRKLFDGLFGDAFRELEDQANGTTTIRNASDKMATAVDKASASIAKLGDAANGAADRLASAGSGGGSGTTVDENGDIVVTAKKKPSTFDPFSKSVDKIFSKLGIKDPQFFGRSIGQNAGKALQGAATGSIVQGVAKAVGIKLNKTGAQIGGAIGGFLPIPGGQIIGSIAGGLIGNLFSKPKQASAGVSISGGQATAGAASGTKSLQAGASSLAGAVADGIQNIAAQLGAQIVGSTNVKIGTYKNQLRVSTNGTPIGGKGSSGAITFQSEADAVAYALRDAIADGVFGGLSDAVIRALKGNTNIDKAVADAMGVKALEAQLNGVTGSLKAAFAAEDAAAKERLRLAQSYGLDIVAVEKLNGEQRTKLVDDALKSRIGGLSDFLNSLKFGDLSEGTAVDKRNALLAQIKVAQADAEAGKDGAGDTLASLYSQLVTTSRDAFGTAGAPYATDRMNATDAVSRVIDLETKRVNDAAGITAASQATTSAVQENNALTNETNDLLARQNAELQNLSSILLSKLGLGADGIDYSTTARQANLQLA